MSDELGSDVLFPFPEENGSKHSPFITYDYLERPEIIGDIAQLLVEGGTIVYPTDTLYGLGAVPLKPETYKKLYELKKRATQKPLSLLVSDPDLVERWAIVPEAARMIMKKAWPGPVTLVLQATENCLPYWQSDRKEVAFRHIGLEHINALVEAVGGVLTTTSANLSGGPDPLSVQDAYKQFEDQVDVYIDGGPVSGVHSTVVRVFKNQPLEVLREGVVSLATLKEIAS